jgi:quinoprotein dehydrogenase-associated probable ABC transporter substrate-binding protein
MQRTNSVARACAAALLLFFGAASAPVDFRLGAGSELRVCADPNNLPFSNARGEGFENKLAELIARDLKKTLIYNWAAEREHFVKDTLGAQLCDVIMGVPEGLNAVDVTQPYYASSYVFVYRKDRHLDLHSIRDPRLKHLKIGVHLIGDDDTPPMQAFARQGIVANVSGFMIFGDYAKPNPPARLVEAVESGAVDVAAVWGPIGGYFAKHSRVPLTVVPITGTDAFLPLVFRYEMGMGVRKGDRLKFTLDRIIARHQTDIRNLLTSYGVPLATSGR